MSGSEKARLRSPEQIREVSFSFEDLLSDPELQELPQGEMVVATLVQIRESYEKNPEKTFLGEGDTAKVFQIEGGEAEGACIKVMHRPKASHNSIDKEMEVHMEAFRSGARVPNPLVSLETESGTGYLVMEKISGHSVKDHVEKDIPFPENFDMRAFMQQLKSELEKLHAHKIFHRDLHAGNVMIDEQGNPVIIDFGASKKTFLSSEDPYRETHLDTVETYEDDDEAIKKIRSTIQTLVLQQKEKGGKKV